MKITIFTPAYNRVQTLPRLYQSLLEQKNKDFEWLIVDDGSTDQTESLIDNFKEEKKIDIRYYKQDNGGKHRAINKGVKEAKGELFFIVDSDDYLTCNALEIVANYINTVKDPNIAGICGLKGKSQTDMVGTTFDKTIKDLYHYERDRYHITGDKAEIFYTNVLRQFPFSEYKDENFITEATVWNQIALAGYRLRYFNEIIYICEYLEDGLTAQIEKKLASNPKGFLEYIQQLLLLNKKNIIKKIRNVSYYHSVVKKQYSNQEICRQLHISRLFLEISVLIRKIAK